MSAEERAADLSLRIMKNIGTFSPPLYNHIGDPHDKWGADKFANSNRMMLARREGLSYSQPAGFFREMIDHERRSIAASVAATASPPASPPAPPTAPPSAATPPGTPMPPGWYYVPSVDATGAPATVLSYVPYWFAAPAGMK